MFTFDVTKLYNDILHELGKQVISFLIETYAETSSTQFNF